MSEGNHDTRWLEQLAEILEEFRRINQNVTANQVLTFLRIAQREGITQKELERLTHLNNGTVSRICAILSDRGLKARKELTMDLIRIKLSPEDYRSRVQVLSPKGKRVFNRLRSVMKPGG